MPRISDASHLLRDQYRDDSKLRARYNLHARFSTNRHGFHRWVFDHVAIAAGGRVLEVGCGPGTLWLSNRDRLPPARDVTLTDFSAGMLNAAERAFRGFGFAPDLAVVDVQALPFAPATFDAAIANHMLYHVPDRPRAIAELRRVLRPGGRLYAATNGRSHMREIFEAAGGRLYSLDGFGLESGAGQLLRSFSEVDVLRYDAGLAITEVEPLLAYARSTQRGGAHPEAVEQLRARAEMAIASEGAFRVTTEAGLLIATV